MVPGGRVPGPIIDLAGDPGPQNPARAGFTEPKPLDAKQGDGTGPTLSGWPRRVEWREFRGRAARPEGENEDARIHTEVFQPERVGVIRERGRRRLGRYEVRVVVNGGGTWVVSDRRTDELLAHEQGHFDITGLTARDMVADLGAIRARNNTDLQRAVSRIIRRAGELARDLTRRYDSRGETNHGRNTERQRAWETHLQRCKDDGVRLSGAPD